MANTKPPKGSKGHWMLNTPGQLVWMNAHLRGKIVAIELAGWMHECLLRVSSQHAKDWMLHTYEARAHKFFPSELLKKLAADGNPLNPAFVEAAVKLASFVEAAVNYLKS